MVLGLSVFDLFERCLGLEINNASKVKDSVPRVLSLGKPSMAGFLCLEG
jgi:hypothetical protein